MALNCVPLFYLNNDETKKSVPLSTGATFEGGVEDVYKMTEKVDYPRDLNTNEITAAVHPQLQVQYRIFCNDLRSFLSYSVSVDNSC